MTHRRFSWVVAALTAAAVVVVAFVYFRSPGPTFTEVDRSQSVHVPEGRSLPSGRGSGATPGVILPYLATPHRR